MQPRLFPLKIAAIRELTTLKRPQLSDEPILIFEFVNERGCALNFRQILSYAKLPI